MCILLIYSGNVYAGTFGISINRQKDFSLPQLDNYLNFTITGKLVDNYIANISYINSDFKYSLLFYITNTQKYFLNYSNTWQSASNDSLTENQEINISYNKKNLFGFSVEYSFYEIDNISFKIGINTHMIKDSYSIDYKHNYQTEIIEKTNESKKYTVGENISDIVLNNTTGYCISSYKSNDFYYINNENTGNYEVLRGYFVCNYQKKIKKIIDNTENDTITKSVYSLVFSPYIVIEMGILKNLYLNAKVGINLYNSIIMGYNKPNINFKINTPKYSSYYSLAIVYQIDF